MGHNGDSFRMARNPLQRSPSVWGCQAGGRYRQSYNRKHLKPIAASLPYARGAPASLIQFLFSYDGCNTTRIQSALHWKRKPGQFQLSLAKLMGGDHIQEHDKSPGRYFCSRQRNRMGLLVVGVIYHVPLGDDHHGWPNDHISVLCTNIGNSLLHNYVDSQEPDAHILGETVAHGGLLVVPVQAIARKARRRVGTGDFTQARLIHRKWLAAHLPSTTCPE